MKQRKNNCVVIMLLVMAFIGFNFCNGVTANAQYGSQSNTQSSAQVGIQNNAETNNQVSNRDIAEHGAYYEMIILDQPSQAKIEELFYEVRGQSIYAHTNKAGDFHVTTEFMPACKHHQWFGKSVIVHVVSYRNQIVTNDKGELTGNEGFGVSVEAGDKALQAYLNALGKNFHITGGYEEGPQYTEKIDFLKGYKMDVYVRGILVGAYMDGTIAMD